MAVISVIPGQEVQIYHFEHIREKKNVRKFAKSSAICSFITFVRMLLSCFASDKSSFWFLWGFHPGLCFENKWLAWKNIINGNYTGMILSISHLCLKSDFFLSCKGTRISSYSFTFKSKLAKKVFQISATCSSLVPGKFLSITIILIGNALLSEIKSLTVFQKVLLFIASFLLSDFVKGYFLKFSRSLFVNLLTFNKVIPCGKPTFLCNLLQQER